MRLGGALALLAAAACAHAADPAAERATLAAGDRSAEDGFAYSPAMRAYRTVRPRWTREALDAFLADPQGVVPDNAMGFFGIANDQERRALVEFLARS